MLHIKDLQLISILTKSQSLSAAARALNVTPPALSTRRSANDRNQDRHGVGRRPGHAHATADRPHAQTFADRAGPSPAGLACARACPRGL